MILKTLNIKNFKQYSEETIEFREGLIGIIGKNGSGKSSIFDAILFALYGDISIDKNLIKFIGAGEKEKVSVKLEFETENKSFYVVRTYKGKNMAYFAELYDSENTLVATGASTVNLEIQKITGMDSKAFRHSVFSGQKELGSISEITGAPRKELVRRMIGMDRIDTIQSMIRYDKNSFEKEASTTESLILSKEALEKLNKENLELSNDLAVYRKKIEITKNKVESISKNYDTAVANFKFQRDLHAKHTDLEKEKIELENKKENSAKNIDKLIIKIKTIENYEKTAVGLAVKADEYIKTKNSLEEMNKQREKFLELENIKKRRNEITKEKNEISQSIKNENEKASQYDLQKSEIDKLSEEINKMKDLLEKIEEEGKKLRVSIGSIDSLINDRKSNVQKITDAGKNSVCPTCLRELHDSYDDVIKKITEEIEKYENQEKSKFQLEYENKKKEYTDLKKRILEKEKQLSESKEKIAETEKSRHILKIYNNKIVELEKSIETLSETESKYNDISYDSDKHNSEKAKFSDLEKDWNEFVKLTALIKQKDEIFKEIEIEKNQIEKNDIELKKKSIEIEKLSFSKEKYKKAEEEQTNLSNEKDNVQKELENITGEFHNLDKKVLEIVNRLTEDERIRKKSSEARENAILLEKLNTLMDGFKSSVLEMVRPMISEEAGNLFNLLTDGRYDSITVDENFDFFITDNGVNYPIKRFSGGEVDLANLCLRIAISKAICEINGGVHSSFLGFDEIFGSQDVSRRNNILSGLAVLQEKYRQIFIISHIDEVKEDLPIIMEVIRSEKGSKIRWIEN